MSLSIQTNMSTQQNQVAFKAKRVKVGDVSKRIVRKRNSRSAQTQIPESEKKLRNYMNDYFPTAKDNFFRIFGIKPAEKI